MYRKNREYDRMQHEKSATWKKCNLTEVQKKNIKTRKKCKIKKPQREKSPS